MRKVKVQSVEEMMRLPEGEWVEVPEGLELEVSYEGTVRVEKDRLTVELPKDARRDLQPWTRGPLHARILNGKLVLERRAAKRKRPGRARP